MTELLLRKNEWRERAKAYRRALSPEKKASLDEAICRAILAHPSFSACDTLLGFYPLAAEPDVRPILSAALSRGMRLALPLCDPASTTMTFRTVDTLQSLSKGSYGLYEPSQDETVLTDYTRALCLVPALIYDRRGFRIGYGKGYYDRFLPHFNGTTVGIVYADLLVDALVHEPTDVAVSMVVTERGICLPNETN